MPGKNYVLKGFCALFCMLSMLIEVKADRVYENVSLQEVSNTVVDIMAYFKTDKRLNASYTDMVEYLTEELSEGHENPNLAWPRANYDCNDDFWERYTWNPILGSEINYGSRSLNLTSVKDTEPFLLQSGNARRFSLLDKDEHNLWMYTFYTLAEGNSRSHLFIIIVEKDIGFKGNDCPQFKSNPTAPLAFNAELKGLFPNPFNDQLYLEVEMINDGLLTVEIFDLRHPALAIHKQENIYPSGAQQILLNTTQILPGAYVARISMGDQLFHMKLIKQE